MRGARILWAALVLPFMLSGCANVVAGAMTAARADDERAKAEADKKPEMTQLEIRELQTRAYSTKDKAKILQVALAVLQDDGYAVSNANPEMGLLVATKDLHEKKVDDSSTAFWKGFFGNGMVSQQKFSHIEATLTVSPFGGQTRVRLSLRLTSMGTMAEVKYEAVTDSGPYQDFFAKLDKGLFIEGQKLS